MGGGRLLLLMYCHAYLLRGGGGGCEEEKEEDEGKKKCWCCYAYCCAPDVAQCESRLDWCIAVFKPLKLFSIHPFVSLLLTPTTVSHSW